MQWSPSAGSGTPTKDPTGRPARLTLGIGVVGLLVLLAVVGASAEHGAGTAELRRGPASVVASSLITLAGLAGVGSLVLLVWGLVTRNRRTLDSSAPKRHSPILVSGVLLAILACFAALLALAARNRHVAPLALAGRPLSRAGSTGSSLPFNTAASVTTSGIVVGIIALLVLAKMVRSIGWRRVLRRLHALPALADTEPDDSHGARAELEALGRELAELTVADPATEPDPRRAVIACYLSMLEVASRHGPERRHSETPTEYLQRIFVMSGAAAPPARALTGLFERARYSDRPVDEAMRSEAIAALGSLRQGLLAGAVG